MIDNLLAYLLRRSLPNEMFERDNSVFHLGFAHQEAVPTFENLVQRTRRVIFMITGLTVFIWAVTILPSILNRQRSWDTDPFTFIFGYLFIGFWLNIALDNDAITATVESVPKWLRRRNDSMMEAALFRVEDVVRAKHAIAQLHVWGRMVGVMTYRAVLIVLLLVDMIFFARNFDDPVRFVFEIGLVMLGGAVFSLEPLYRVRSVAALGVVIHSGQTILSGIQAWMVIVFLWIVQIVIAAMLMIAVSMIFRPFYDDAYIAQRLELVLDLILIAILFYRLYKWIGQRALAYAMHQVDA